MHTTTEIHAATKVAQQMAKKKKEKKKDEHKELGTNIHLKELNETWFRTTHFTTNSMTITTNSVILECFDHEFPNLWNFDSDV